jgi:DNA-binding FadR family transcriptional regulator
LILALMDSIVDLLSDQRKMIFAVRGGPERGQQHHKRVMVAIATKDPEAARNSMREHLKQVRADTRQALLGNPASNPAKRVTLP